jgi:hypothetical protein
MTNEIKVPYQFGPTQTIVDTCEENLVDGMHSCLVGEYKCECCGCGLKPYNCHGCGRFLSPAEMNAGETRCNRGCR